MKNLYLTLIALLAFAPVGNAQLDGSLTVVVEEGATLSLTGRNVNNGELAGLGLVQVDGSLLGGGRVNLPISGVLRFIGRGQDSLQVSRSLGGIIETLDIDKRDGDLLTFGEFTIDTLDFADATATRLVIGDDDLSFNANGRIIGADEQNYVLIGGRGKVEYRLSGDSDCTFPIGDATAFTPLTVSATGSRYFNGRLAASVSAEAPGELPASTSDQLNRHWDITHQGIQDISVVTTGSYVPADVAGNEDNILGAFYAPPGEWFFDGAARNENTVSATLSGAGPWVFSGFDISVLPVEFIDFTGSALGKTDAELRWRTAREDGSDFYAVERSSDAVRWENVGSVAAAGFSDTERAYTFRDRNVPSVLRAAGPVYYRLRQVDQDGGWAYSAVIAVAFAGAEAPRVFPNPVTDVLRVIAASPEALTTELFDAAGRRVATGSGDRLDVAHLPAGVYQLRIQQGSVVFQERVVKR